MRTCAAAAKDPGVSAGAGVFNVDGVGVGSDVGVATGGSGGTRGDVRASMGTAGGDVVTAGAGGAAEPHVGVGAGDARVGDARVGDAGDAGVSDEEGTGGGGGDKCCGGTSTWCSIWACDASTDDMASPLSGGLLNRLEAERAICIMRAPPS